VHWLIFVQAFATSVNSPLKPPSQSTNKDGTPNNTLLNRRSSIIQNAVANSPSVRPGNRRRESGGDHLQYSNPLSSPTANNRISREESGISSPPPSLLRRKTDLKDSTGPGFDGIDKDFTAPPLGPPKRTSTNPASAGLNGPSSPWSGAPLSAGFSPMGAFGNFALGGQTPTSAERKPGFSSMRGESRFKGMMNAADSEDMGSKVKDKASANNLAETNEQSRAKWGGDVTSHAHSLQQIRYADEEDFHGGSAALRGGDDASPPRPQSSRYRNPDRQSSFDEIGFSSLGLPSDLPPFRELMQRREYAQQQTPQRSQGMGQINEPMSPTNTNPYQSPEGEKATLEDVDTDDSDLQHHLYGAQYGSSARGFQNLDARSGDRSQTSSTGASRGFPSLSGLGNLGGLGGVGPWVAASGAIGTPSRAQAGYPAGYGDASFGGIGELTSPQTGFGGSNFFGAGGPAMGSAGALGRGSKLSSLLPTTMEEQMRADVSRQDQGLEDDGDYHAPGFSSRDTENSSRSARVGIDELFGNSRGIQGISSPFVGNESSQLTSSQAPVSAAQTPFSVTPSASSYFGRSQEQDTSSSQMPATQQRQMVMPDRMRWIYRDPSGNMQGPWSGLEMHDWYKAGFFSPELQVKKLEDTDYEPLAQLIRRIGNSREPFLVPQIGIPHGPPTTLPTSSTATAAAIPATTPSSAQPPFASSFPSFGTTLSAEQQNALERRKQEEQYLMARQKEHLAQQQVILKQMQHMQGGQLHHHSSAHSLQSQPSYGSITSPMAYQPSPAQGPIQPPTTGPGFFEGQSRGAGPLGVGGDPLNSVREEDLPGFMERLAMGRGGQQSFNGETQGHQQRIAAIMHERARLEQEQQQFMLQRGDEDQRISADRLEQYQQLRAQEDQRHYQQQAPIGGNIQHQASEVDPTLQQHRREVGSEIRDQPQMAQNVRRPGEPLSLSEQVQKAAAKQPTAQPQSPWAKVDSGLPQPFPPPQSQSPMPAPTPQRNRQSVADALNAESQSPSNADSVETPGASLAPWAKDKDEPPKGPSLKEIQAMEAKQAAEQEQLAAAARRAVAEQELLTLQTQPVAPAPGLPSSANWANGISPTVPASTASPWAKPAAAKPAVAVPSTGAKKTLAQIQKEEEHKKNRQAAAQAAAAANLPSTATPLAGGKRYADLASKPTALAQQFGSTAWTTVGASGKVKTPSTPTPGLNTRTVTGGIAQPSATAVKPKPTLSTAAKTPGSQQHANDEFQKWVKSALGKGLNPNIPGEFGSTEPSIRSTDE